MQGSASHLFEGVRVLDLTRVMSGPFCTAMLADLGADVIKIELPGVGEEARHFAPHIKGESTYFALLNRGKRSVTVNLKSEEGIALIRDLARKADVLVENFRPGVMDRLGLGYDAIRADNPKLIYASISGFGQQGTYADWPAFDLCIQAMSGLMSITGERDGRPMAVGESIADVATGMFAAWGIAAALYDREKTGTGRRLEVAMLDSLFSMMLTALARGLFTDQAVRRVGNRHPETYPVDSFSTRDGDVVLVGFMNPVVKRLFDVIGKPELFNDARFKDNPARNANEAELRALIADWASGLTREQAIEQLRKADIPAAPVWTLKDLLESGYVAERGLLQPGSNNVLGDIQLAPQPVKFDNTPPLKSAHAPTLGEHTDNVLTSELGLSAARIAELRATKAV